jgi:hypothetical protein
MGAKFESQFKQFDESAVNASSVPRGRNALLATQRPVIIGFSRGGDLPVTWC